LSHTGLGFGETVTHPLQYLPSASAHISPNPRHELRLIGDRMIHKVNAADLAEILHDMGFRALIETPSEDSEWVTITSGSYGHRWHVEIQEIDDESDRLNFELITFVDGSHDVDTFCNEFNMEHALGALWHSESPDYDGSYSLFADYSIRTHGGINESWLRHEVEMWDFIVSKLDKALNTLQPVQPGN